MYVCKFLFCGSASNLQDSSTQPYKIKLVFAWLSSSHASVPFSDSVTYFFGHLPPYFLQYLFSYINVTHAKTEFRLV